MKSTTIPNRSKTITMTIPKVKVRKEFAGVTRAFANLRAYNRRASKSLERALAYD